MKKTMFAAGAAALAIVLGACGGDPSTSDFKKQTADFINGKQMAEETSIDFSDAKCQEPASTDVGTTYTCTALGSDGVTYELGVTITSKNGFTVQSFKPAGSDTGTPTTTTA